MALLDTINTIEQRREKVMNRRQRRVARGEDPLGLPIDPMQLREAMSKLNDTFQKNRKKVLEERDRQRRMNEAMQRVAQEEEARKSAPQQPAQGQMGQMAGQQQQMAQQQMPQSQGLLGGMAGAGGMQGMAQSPTGPLIG